jgi:hypothetical protein
MEAMHRLSSGLMGHQPLQLLQHSLPQLPLLVLIRLLGAISHSSRAESLQLPPTLRPPRR